MIYCQKAWARVAHLIAGLLISFTSVQAADVRNIYSKHNGNYASTARLEIVGEVKPGDSGGFASLLAKAVETSFEKERGGPVWDWRPVVLLSSPGGDVAEAMKIGRMLRAARATAVVNSGAKCASACTLILAGAVYRYSFNGTKVSNIGIHRISPGSEKFLAMPQDEALKAYNRMKLEVRDYLSEMGIGNRLYELMFSVSSSGMQWLSRDEAEDTQILGHDPAIEEWVKAKKVETRGADWVRREEAYVGCLNRVRSESTENAACRKETGFYD